MHDVQNGTVTLKVYGGGLTSELVWWHNDVINAGRTVTAENRHSVRSTLLLSLHSRQQHRGLRTAKGQNSFSQSQRHEQYSARKTRTVVAISSSQAEVQIVS